LSSTRRSDPGAIVLREWGGDGFHYGGGFLVGHEERQVVLGDLPVRAEGAGEDAGAAEGSVALVGEDLVEPRDVLGGAEGDVAGAWRVDPGGGLVEGAALEGVGVELAPGPSLGRVGAEEAGVGGEQVEVAVEIGLGGGGVEGVERLVDGGEVLLLAWRIGEQGDDREEGEADPREQERESAVHERTIQGWSGIAGVRRRSPSVDRV